MIPRARGPLSRQYNVAMFVIRGMGVPPMVFTGRMPVPRLLMHAVISEGDYYGDFILLRPLRVRGRGSA